MYHKPYQDHFWLNYYLPKTYQGMFGVEILSSKNANNEVLTPNTSIEPLFGNEALQYKSS